MAYFFCLECFLMLFWLKGLFFVFPIFDTYLRFFLVLETVVLSWGFYFWQKLSCLRLKGLFLSVSKIFPVSRFFLLFPVFFQKLPINFSLF